VAGIIIIAIRMESWKAGKPGKLESWKAGKRDRSAEAKSC